MGNTLPAEPFRLTFPGSHHASSLLRAAERAVERLLSLRDLQIIYRDACCQPEELSFADRTLRAMRCTYDTTPAGLTEIPSTGPLIVVANHPFGGVEGLVLCSLLHQVRRDVKLMANYLLNRIPEMQPDLIMVDPFGGSGATQRNVRAMRTAIEWVRQGGALGVFPSGTVSHLQWRERGVTDPPWSRTIGRIVQITGAPVVPVFFDGTNSSWFQLAGLIHARLRTLLLPRQLANKRGASLRVHVGRTIPSARMERIGTDTDLTTYLRVRTYVLRAQSCSLARGTVGRARSSQPQVTEPIAESEGVDAIAAEIGSLPAANRLLESSSLVVLHARAPQIPAALREIGRLRELTFRAVGEGTGKARDIDRFDEHYVHLFAWHPEQRRIVGAYRLGPTDELVTRFGVDGLYTSTLFRYSPRLLEKIHPALEMGRSFVVNDFQRSYSALLLLWRGIGRFVVTHPQYRNLFGTVSISDDYHTMTKSLLIAFLRMSGFRSALERLVRPKNPPRIAPLPPAEGLRLAAIARDLGDVDELVSEIESDHKPMPVLLRQYLKLNAKVLGFNIDPDFGDVLDGLVLVDLCSVDRDVLDKYMGREEAAAFLAHHRD